MAIQRRPHCSAAVAAVPEPLGPRAAGRTAFYDPRSAQVNHGAWAMSVFVTLWLNKRTTPRIQAN